MVKSRFFLMTILARLLSFGFCLALIFFASVVLGYGGESVNESEMFSSSDSVVESAGALLKEAAAEAKHVGFSGEITSALINSVARSSSALNSLTVGNIFLDVRLPKQIKGFANMETVYLAKDKSTTVLLRELFFDFSLKQKFYFRTGKQVLQWGRCAFWSPTDLINVERKTFIRKIGYREGAYGLKAHVPFGTRLNLYGFWDTGDASSAEESAGALKAEFLIGGTEMAFSGWMRRKPVFGYDLSTRFYTVDIAGEYSVSRGDVKDRLQLKDGMLSLTRRRDEWLSSASVSFRKSFRLGNFRDRVSVTSEWYYNEAGAGGDIFGDDTIYPYAQPIVPFLGAPVASGTQRDFLRQNNLYEAHYHSRYYTALFTSVSRFILTDLVFNMNLISNLSDSSAILSTGVAYKNIHNFSAGILANVNLGGKQREYTFSDQIYDLQLTCGIAF